MWDGLEWAHKFDLPIIITENGVEDDTDALRPRYLVEHLHQVWRAANFNWRVKGYFHWSLVDNFEWERGWTQRFGLVGAGSGNPATHPPQECGRLRVHLQGKRYRQRDGEGTRP